MIIKLLPVKTHGGINRVVDYIATDKNRIGDYRTQSVFHNVSKTDLWSIKRELHDNYERYARKRSNGVKSMHCILSVSPLDRDKMTIEKMDDIVRTYLGKAYPNALAFGSHHLNEQHIHSHIVISSNELASSRSTRQSKSDLQRYHSEMLEHIRENHKELQTNIDEKNWGRKLHSENAYYAEKRNPDLKLTKDLLSEKIQSIFRQSESSAHFYEQLGKMGFQTYEYKDRVQGIHYGEDNKKMRFSRLGLEHEKIEELDIQFDRVNELEQIREENTYIKNDRNVGEANSENDINWNGNEYEI